MKNTGLADDLLDVAVFSLSLMNRNWTDYIIEAKRCLATNGYLLIAETTKSLKGRLFKLRDVLREQLLKYIPMKKKETSHLLKQGNYRSFSMEAGKIQQ
jgi:hypothetical protein